MTLSNEGTGCQVFQKHPLRAWLITFKVSAEERQALRDAAQRQGIRIAELIRAALRSYLQPDDDLPQLRGSTRIEAATRPGPSGGAA